MKDRAKAHGFPAFPSGSTKGNKEIPPFHQKEPGAGLVLMLEPAVAKLGSPKNLVCFSIGSSGAQSGFTHYMSVKCNHKYVSVWVCETLARKPQCFYLGIF